jgi:hypothetical protein
MMRTSILLLVLMSSIAAANPATTLPTTRPAKVDLSSPDATVRSLADVLDQNDADAFLKIVSQEQRLQMDDQVRMMLIGQRLISAVRQHIGETEAADLAQNLDIFGMPVSGHGGDGIRDLLKDPEIKWKRTGDDAVLGEVTPEIRVRRIDSKWYWVLPPDKAQDRADYAKLRVEVFKAFEETIRDINSGRIKTTAQIAKRIMPVVSSEATSEPTTKPAH